MRSGSTLLAEALTQPPHSYIFAEPGLGRNHFRFKPGDVALLSPYGVDLIGFVRNRARWAFFHRRLRHFGHTQDYMLRAFKQVLLPRLPESMSQIGVKEVRHLGWQNYLRHFPDMRVVMTGRDPRDIYLSMHARWKAGTLPPGRVVSPERIADDVNHQFQMQVEILRVTEHRTIRYEDLCRRPELLADIQAFADSPASGAGSIGQFTARDESRIREYHLHGGSITGRQIERWKREPNADLVAQARRTFDLLREYCDFWGYQ